MPREHRIYVLDDHMVGVKAALDACGLATERHRIQRVTTVNHVAGCDRGTFIVLAGKSPIPADIENAIRRIGMVVILIDDTWARERALREF